MAYHPSVNTGSQLLLAARRFLGHDSLNLNTEATEMLCALCVKLERHGVHRECRLGCTYPRAVSRVFSPP